MNAEIQNIIRISQELADVGEFKEALLVLESAPGILGMYQKSIVCILAAQDISNSFIFKNYAPHSMKANLMAYLVRANDLLFEVAMQLPSQSKEIQNLLCPLIWGQIHKAEYELARHRPLFNQEEETWDADSHAFYVTQHTDIVTDQLAEWSL